MTSHILGCERGFEWNQFIRFSFLLCAIERFKAAFVGVSECTSAQLGYTVPFTLDVLDNTGQKTRQKYRQCTH